MRKFAVLTLPHLDHPLFKLECRHIRWGASVGQLRRYSLQVFAFVSCCTFGFWLLGLLTGGPDYYGVSGRMMRSSNFIGLAALISIAADVLLDLASLGFTLNSIDVKARPLWWDLLRVTPVELQSLIAAKHAVAQVRAWRVMAVIVSLRACVAVLVVLHVIVVTSGFGFYIPASQFMLIPTIGVFGATYVVEPLWRMRAMTALGLRISARVRHTAFAGLAAFGATLLVWIVQALIMGLILHMTALMVLNLASSEAVAIWGVFLACCATAWVVYAFYSGLRAWSLNMALRYTFAD